MREARLSAETSSSSGGLTTGTRCRAPPGPDLGRGDDCRGVAAASEGAADADADAATKRRRALAASAKDGCWCGRGRVLLPLLNALATATRRRRIDPQVAAAAGLLLVVIAGGGGGTTVPEEAPTALARAAAAPNVGMVAACRLRNRRSDRLRINLRGSGRLFFGIVCVRRGSGGLGAGRKRVRRLQADRRRRSGTSARPEQKEARVLTTRARTHT
jgi:hypothetical protein